MFDWFTGPSLAIGITIVVVIGLLIAWGVRHLEARSRRDEDASRLQQTLAERLAREPALAGSGVVPVVSVPWRGRPRVELTGWVPTRSMHDAALRTVAREAERLGRELRLLDSLEVLQERARRGA